MGSHKHKYNLLLGTTLESAILKSIRRTIIHKALLPHSGLFTWPDFLRLISLKLFMLVVIFGARKMLIEKPNDDLLWTSIVPNHLCHILCLLIQIQCFI